MLASRTLPATTTKSPYTNPAAPDCPLQSTASSKPASQRNRKEGVRDPYEEVMRQAQEIIHAARAKV
jgi:hypothetical protein